MKTIIHVVNNTFVFLLYVIILTCGILVAIFATSVIRMFLSNLHIFFQFAFIGIEIFFASKIIYYVLKNINKNLKIIFYKNNNSMEKEAIKFYGQLLAIGFAVGLLYLIPLTFDALNIL